MIVEWSQTRFSVWAVAFLPTPRGFIPVGLDVTSVEVNYGLNEIPSAALSVAVGFEAFGGAPSNIHAIADRLRMVVPVQVWVTAAEQATSSRAEIVSWPQLADGSPAPFMIFEGYATKIAPAVNQAGTSKFEMSLSHWLDDLNFSSALSRSSHTTNPAHYYNPAGLFMVGAGGLGKSFVGQTMAAWAFNEQVILRDLWAYTLPGAGTGGLLGYLTRLCEQDLLQAREVGITPGRTRNVEALQALRRFEPFIDAVRVNGVDRPVYKYGRPLAMRLGNLTTANELARVIAQEVMKESLDATTTQTVWAKLVGGHASATGGGYAPMFMTALVPMVSRALFVPLQSGLRVAWQTVSGEDYESSTDYTNLIRPLRGIGIMTGVASHTGAFGVDPTSVNDGIRSIGGYYENASLPGGVVQFMTGPAWMSRVKASDVSAAMSVNPGGPSGSAFFPGAGPAPLGRSPTAAQSAAYGLLNGYARALYINEALVGRTRVLSGRPRFDIAPGSSVRILSGNGDRGATFGTLARISIGFDAESMRAYSNMLLTHVRTAAENEDDATSIPGHPLWQHVWRGAPLVDHPAFGSPYPQPWETADQPLGRDGGPYSQPRARGGR